MGTASFSVGKYGRRINSGGLFATEVKTSGAFATSTTAANLEDGIGDITLAAGDVLQIHASEAMRIAFGGTAATASTGHYIPEGAQREFECTDAGFVSIIDVA
ncbi:hypothetical protein N6L27_03520 [Leisingera sp. SS27]|uniref:hypothetical protein n=1 Tax=Leisingera sp. SS27 TaxID=2979462 RepID=UPI00232D23C5|nr:hypothetical protein [Leisingera sp. SS27]MDC0657060.1 hypothetical protein [Leisingera sp. SS27]